MTRQFIGSRALPRLSSGIERILLVDYRGIQSRAVIMFDALESLLRTRQEMVNAECGRDFVLLRCSIRGFAKIRRLAKTGEYVGICANVKWKES
jgi:hypothetical protein